MPCCNLPVRLFAQVFLEGARRTRFRGENLGYSSKTPYDASKPEAKSKKKPDVANPPALQGGGNSPGSLGRQCLSHYAPNKALFPFSTFKHADAENNQ